MPRRKSPPKRDILPDPVYNSKLVTRFINNLMKGGKRNVAESIFYGMLESVEKKTKEQPLNIFKKAVENVKPTLEVKSRRVGGATYQVPIEVSPERRTALAIRWLIRYSSERKDQRTMRDKMAFEVMDAANGAGNAVKKKEDVHRMADASKAFAHYRW